MYKDRQPRIVLVTRETRMDGVLKRWSNRGLARHVLKQRKVDFAVKGGNLALADDAELAGEHEFLDLEQEDTTYRTAIHELARSLDFDIPFQTLPRDYLPTYDFERCAVVVVAGQDGLVANTAKYVGSVPIVGVNPDPERFDGVLLPFHIHEARTAVARVLKRQAAFREVTLAEASLHDGQRLLAFNDLFVGAGSHVSARYQLTLGESSERQSSSGVLVSTGAGSTGWMSSVYNMARGVASSLGATIKDSHCPRLEWEDRALLWAVREPFRSRVTGASLVCGRLNEQQAITIESEMPTDGVIFSDGVETDFLEFNSGAIARIGIADQRARLVVNAHRR